MNRILFFVNSLGNGGAERVCDNLSKKYVDMGYKVDFVLLFDNYSYSTVHSQYNILCLGLNPKKSKITLIIKIILNRNKIKSFIKKNMEGSKYKLISAHLPLSHICASLSGVGKECLYVQHTSLKAEERYFSIYKRFYKNKINICVSEGLNKEFVECMKYNKNNVLTIYNPVPIDKIKELSMMPLEINKPYILSVGRLIELKRFDRAIDIFYKGEFYKKFNLVILGEGYLREKLMKQANSYHILDNVIFPGWQSNVYSWMKNSVLLLQTSDREALPMVLIEGLASGAKIVASNCEFGADEILQDNLKRYIANKDDIHDYIRKINDALENFLVCDNYPILERCKDETVCEKYIKTYEHYFEEDSNGKKKKSRLSNLS